MNDLAAQTAWEGGIYKLTMSFPEGQILLLHIFDRTLNALASDYPSKPPKCKNIAAQALLATRST